MLLKFLSKMLMISKNYLSLKREFDIFVLAPIFHVHLEAGTAFRSVLVGNLDTAHYDDPSLRLYGDLIGHVEIERLDFPVLQAHFKVQPITAFARAV